jgi:hypothetical protein
MERKVRNRMKIRKMCSLFISCPDVEAIYPGIVVTQGFSPDSSALKG